MKKGIYEKALEVATHCTSWFIIKREGDAPISAVMKALEEQRDEERQKVRSMLDDIVSNLDMSRRRVRPDEVVKLINDKKFEYYGYDAILSA